MRILITGSSSGLGRILRHTFEDFGHTVISYDLKDGNDVANPSPALAENIRNRVGGLDILINCAGVNGIDYLEDLTDDAWQKIMDTNAKGIMAMSRACLPLLIESKGTILNIVSNAASMPMTASLAYNASKGAALIMTRQLARELTRRHGITVFSVSPNKLKGTGMSRDIERDVQRVRGWSAEEAERYQLASMLCGEETDAETVADFIVYLLSHKQRHKFLSGCDIPYGV